MSILGHDKSVIAVLSLINHAGLFGRRIVKYEKRVSDKVHLHDRFLGGHGGVLELLGSDNNVLFLDLLTANRAFSYLRIGNDTLAQLLAKLRLVLSDLPFNIIN